MFLCVPQGRFDELLRRNISEVRDCLVPFLGARIHSSQRRINIISTNSTATVSSSRETVMGAGRHFKLFRDRIEFVRHVRRFLVCQCADPQIVLRQAAKHLPARLRHEVLNFLRKQHLDMTI